MWGASSGGTPVVDSFIANIMELIRDRNGAKLQDYLQIEPPLPPVYQDMVTELKSQYPQSANTDDQLLGKCESAVPPGSSWSSFPLFLRQYFIFVRDVNVDNLLDTYDLLKALLKYVAMRSLLKFESVSN